MNRISRVVLLIGVLSMAAINILASTARLKKHECWSESEGWTSACYDKAKSVNDLSASLAAILKCGVSAGSYIEECDLGPFYPFERHARRESMPQ